MKRVIRMLLSYRAFCMMAVEIVYEERLASQWSGKRRTYCADFEICICGGRTVYLQENMKL